MVVLNLVTYIFFRAKKKDLLQNLKERGMVNAEPFHLNAVRRTEKIFELKEMITK